MSLASPRLAALCALALLIALPAPSRAQSQEERRRQLQERLGIRQPAAPTAGAPDAGVAHPPAAPTAPPEAPAQAAGTPSKRPPAAARPRVPTFAEDAKPVLEKACASCHRPEGVAAKSRWVLRGEPGDYEATLRFVKREDAAQSPLLRKGTGATLHGGKKSLAAESPEYTTLLRWIEGGAVAGRAQVAAAPVPAGPTPPAPASSPAQDAKPPRPASPPLSGPVVAAPVPSEPAFPASTAPGFEPRVHELLLSGCASCHAVDGMAAASRYLTHPDARQHFQSAVALVVPGGSGKSVLFERARGEAHPVGAIWEPGSPELTLLAQWIDAGAPGPAPAPAEAPGPPPPVSAAPAPAPTGPPASPAPPAGAQGHGGISLGTYPLLGSLRLNGRFDLNYERLGYNDHPFQDAGVNALRSYHHFLFLSRQSTEDPVSLTVEVLSLQFWEVGARLSPEAWPVKVSAKLGKLLVPFGGEPLYHHNHGGHAGFDQRVLPVIFAREGVALNAQRRVGAFRLSADAYAISGYRLREADSLINLQSDFAPLEDVKFGYGARLAASWGPLSVWYSPYYNRLGFGRRLFMQSLDVTAWRPRGYRFLEHFSLSAGLLRADVSGGTEEGYGGPGADYFHFASYALLRYHPNDWLYVQYRQGLRTFGNQRGLILDRTDLTRQDGSTHNVGVVARWQGLSAGLYHYWNMEKADETPDDFTRLVVAYEF